MSNVLREFAPDQASYDAFVQQWFFDVVVPIYRFEEVELTEANGKWTVNAVLTNRGTGADAG